MKKLYITLSLIICVIAFSNAQNSSADQLVKTIFETKIAKLKSDVIENTSNDESALSAEFKEEMSQSIGALYKQLSDKIVATYATEEITYLVDFYKSPVGQKLLKTSEQFTNETAAVLQDWQMAQEEIALGSN